MEIMNKKYMIFFIIGGLIIAATLVALAICGFVCPLAINFFSIATLAPAGMMSLAAYGFVTGMLGRMDPRKKYGFKYSKLDGVAYVERPDLPRIGKSYLGGCISFLLMSVMLPFVFFFSDNVKYWVGIASLIVVSVALVGFLTFVFVIASREAKRLRDEERAEAERLRREQEERESLGKWK